MPGLGDVLHNEVQILLESHVEHTVGLVEHHFADLGEIQSLPLDHVLQPSGGSDDDVRSPPEGVDLPVDGCSPVDGGADVSRFAGDLPELGVHLHGELPGGSDNDCGRDLPPVTDPAEHNHGVSAGLAGPGLGLGDQVVACHPYGYRFALDGSGLRPPHVHHGVDERTVYSEFFKRGHWFSILHERYRATEVRIYAPIKRVGACRQDIGLPATPSRRLVFQEIENRGGRTLGSLLLEFLVVHG